MIQSDKVQELTEECDRLNQAVIKLAEELETAHLKIINMQEDVEFLDCLKCAGVDNWSGYGDAWAMMEEEDDD